MLKSLEFENFKSWGGRHRLDFGSITGLFGANSSGKSSIIHLLLLLKQTAETRDSRLTLNFGGNSSYIDLGSFLDIVTDHDINKQISYSLNWDPRTASGTLFDPDIHNIEVSSVVEAVDGSRGEEVFLNELRYQIRCSFDAGPIDDEDPDDEILELYEGHFTGLLSVTSKRSPDGSHTVHLSFDRDAHYDSSCIEDSPQPLGLYRLHPETLSKASLDLEDEVPEDAYGVRRVGTAGYHLEWAIDGTEYNAVKLLQDIVYLGPLRDHPSRHYRWTGTAPATVGHRGQQAMQVLLAGKSVSVDAVSEWLRRIGIANSMSLKQVGEGARIWEPLITLHDGRTQVNLADVGFGVSQVLPVIVALLSAPPGSLVILEHPDIHLHPKAQSELADLLIEVASAGEIQILVESHSEHLLARIQRRVAESGRGDGGLAPEDVRLYFCEQEQGKSKLTPLEMQPSGLITNWPRDFFGDMLASGWHWAGSIRNLKTARLTADIRRFHCRLLSRRCTSLIRMSGLRLIAVTPVAQTVPRSGGSFFIRCTTAMARLPLMSKSPGQKRG